jgi:hypothetical protein
MKRQTYRRLLVTVGIVLLIGLVASCGEKSEPRFKVIESMEYTEATGDSVSATLTNKHLDGMQRLLNTEIDLWRQYYTDVYPLIRTEMQNKNPLYGLIMIIKADNYRIRYRGYWTTKPDFTGSYSVWQ